MGIEGAQRLVKQERGHVEEMEKENDLRLPEEDKDDWARGKCGTMRKCCPQMGAGESSWSSVGGRGRIPVLSRHWEEAGQRAGEEGKTA